MEAPTATPRPRAADRIALGGALVVFAAAVVIAPERWPADAPLVGSGHVALVKSAQTGSSRKALELKTKHPDKTIFSGVNLRPRDWLKGWVLVRNETGNAVPALTLTHRVRSTVGPMGGSLGSRLVLRIVRVKHRVRHRIIFRDTLDRAPGELALGVLRDGRQRLYRFKLRLPGSRKAPAPGEGDNVLQGATATIRFVWHLSES